MRDPELVVRAQVAASALECAWYRWRVEHGHTSDPMPAVSSYVGYSLQEPWGQPRVVFGLAAEDAEQLAALLERPDRVESAFAAAAAQPGVRDLRALAGARGVTLPLPRQAPPAAVNKHPLADLLPADEHPAYDEAYDEPLYRQAAAAMKEAAAARESASRAMPDDAEPERTGELARAASAARAEAEARIRAAMSTPDDEQRADVREADAEAAGAEDRQDTAVDDVRASESDADDSQEVPQTYAADVLEPLPTPAGMDEADAPGAEEPAAPSQDADDHEIVADADADAADGPSAAARRGRVTRSYPITRLSKTKRPGVPSAPAPANPTDVP